MWIHLIVAAMDHYSFRTTVIGSHSKARVCKLILWEDYVHGNFLIFFNVEGLKPIFTSAQNFEAKWLTQRYARLLTSLGF